MLDQMSQPMILHNLKDRFVQNEIYTNVGTILISMNPYKLLPLYTPTIIQQYRSRGSKDMAPHIFTIADDSFNALIDYNQSQSIVISGESGAGHTHTRTHTGMRVASSAPRHRCSRSRESQQSSPIDAASSLVLCACPSACRQDRVHEAVSVLLGGDRRLELQRGDAHPAGEPHFGRLWKRQNHPQQQLVTIRKIRRDLLSVGAHALHSRVKSAAAHTGEEQRQAYSLAFSACLCSCSCSCAVDKKNSICGAQNTNYLLEKVRVVQQTGDERNYHIFYRAGHTQATRICKQR
jgi:hypothetical protein